MPDTCPGCGTQLSPRALACPACGVLLHAAQLKTLAANAEAADARGDALVAREHWLKALDLLPPSSQQHASVSARINNLSTRLESGPVGQQGSASGNGRWSKAGGIGATLLFAASKLKFLLLGLTKASTFVSMFAFFAVYWSIYGWPLALGLALSIYVHEMGHVSMLRKLGIAADAPLFIPGVGALVLLRQPILDPVVDARIGLAGPVWGLAAALTAAAVYAITGAKIWFAIAQLTAYINLFNLIPVWQLDGSRGFHALSRSERWMVVGVVALALWASGLTILLLVGGVGVWRAMQRDTGPGHTPTCVTFIVLVALLSLLATGVA